MSLCLVNDTDMREVVEVMTQVMQRGELHVVCDPEVTVMFFFSSCSLSRNMLMCVVSEKYQILSSTYRIISLFSTVENTRSQLLSW